MLPLSVDSIISSFSLTTKEAAIFPPSTAITPPVVFMEVAK